MWDTGFCLKIFIIKNLKEKDGFLSTQMKKKYIVLVGASIVLQRDIKRSHFTF